MSFFKFLELNNKYNTYQMLKNSVEAVFIGTFRAFKNISEKKKGKDKKVNIQLKK